MAPERDSSAEWHSIDDSGDDDMDFELASEESTNQNEDEEEDAAEEGATLYYDSVSRTLYAGEGVHVADEHEAEVEPTGTETPRAAPTIAEQEAQPSITITRRQIYQLLRSAGLQAIFRPSASAGPRTRAQTRRGNGQLVSLPDDEEEDEDDDDDDYDRTWIGYRPTRRTRNRNFTGERWPKVPSEHGQKLMASGAFGTNDRCDHSACGEPFDESVRNKRRRLSRRLLDRELGTGGFARTQALSRLSTHDLIPGSKADMIINLENRCYSGQFSEDGSFYFACGQDFKVRMYDTSNPYDWKYYKTVNYWGGSWTITDASLSPDNKLLAYSSIRSMVCLARTDQADTSEPQMLNFSDMGDRRRRDDGGGHFGIWSLRFSGDGSEIVAGTSNDSVYVYDLEAQRSILRIPGHQDDVNAVCFGDKMSPHILYSGSDDTTIKIWDRRSLSSMRPAGMFLGHTEGLTYVDSKGDGRYVISNGKDQTCKLWDLRRMVSTDVAEKLDPRDFSTGFDYRLAGYDHSQHEPHPHDCSLVTFRGHKVLKTLIRCHFSPAMSTDQKYVYSGSHDGKIWIWNLDGTKKAEIDVLEATKGSRPQGDNRYQSYDFGSRTGQWKTIVRDCSWHPSAPIITATSWNGWDHQYGTCTVHSWTDGADGDEITGDDADPSDPKRSLGATPMGARVTPKLQHDQSFYGTRTSGQYTRRAATLLRNRLGLDDDYWENDE